MQNQTASKCIISRCILGCWISLAAVPWAGATDSTEVKALLARPPREYASAPLWVWNDLLTADQIRGTLRDLAGQQVKQVFVHPRPGLMTPYLGEDWFRLWKVALDEAARLDMNVWIYDENSYPSGFAGGWVPELMPESHRGGMQLRESATAPKWAPNLVAVYRLEGDHWTNVTAQAKAGEALPQGRYLVGEIELGPSSPWFGNRWYVDLLRPGVTEKFLEVTLGAYRREIGEEFGRRVPGSFTDEPNIGPERGLTWTGDLAEQFQKRWGYDLLDHLPSLTREVGDWRKVRHNYYSTLNALYVERWAKPYYEWCEKNGLQFTGHYWDHEWPNCNGVPDNMAMAAWQQTPGIDCLMNQYREDTHAQFGNVRMTRELLSVANQLGRKRTLCEIYGAGGWDLRFEDMKRIADWLAVLGVNLFDEHLSYITLRGARKRDHPQSFSYHEPWWDSYHVIASYLTRLSCALSQGEQINQILVLEPTTTAWMYQGNPGKLKELSDGFFKLLLALESAQVEYDLGCEDIIARHGQIVTNAVSPNYLKVGRRTYQTVVVPALTENLDRRTWEFFRPQSSLHVMHVPPRPDRRDGERFGSPAPTPGGQTRESVIQSGYYIDTLVRTLTAKPAADGFAIRRAANDRGLLFHHRRQLDDGQILFLVNTSIESPSAGTIESPLRGIEEWDLFTGAVRPFAFVRTDRGVQASFELPPSGSLLLFLAKQAMAPAPMVGKTLTRLAPAGATEVRRLGPNVLTLDYVNITAAGETKSNLYFYPANQLAWKKNGLERNPWDSAVQFKDELISKKFGPESGFTASYRFTVEGAVPPDLAIVIERADLYTISCNGQELRAAPGDWWLDKAFGRLPIAGVAKVGENVVTIKVQPFTMYHELEPAYVLGDFTLRATDKGFVIAPGQPLRLEPELGWNKQGHPFYAQGVTYQQRFTLGELAGRYVVVLPRWYGSVARVQVNGQPAGHIVAPPWECDVTKQLQRGDNAVEVVVVGTLKNTLGPHHGNPSLGSAWPGMFHQGPADGPPPGDRYHTVGYGLFEPFVLKQILSGN